MWLFVIYFFGMLFMFGPFIQHIVTTINHGMVTLLIFGVIIPPIGWFHGLGIWLGIWIA